MEHLRKWANPPPECLRVRPRATDDVLFNEIVDGDGSAGVRLIYLGLTEQQGGPIPMRHPPAARFANMLQFWH
jgi:hypothetical protein